MTTVTYLGYTGDPDELRTIAAAIDAGEPGWRDQVDALPRYILLPGTLKSEPEVIAEHLRGCAKFLENRRDGVPVGGQAFVDAMARLREQSKAARP